MVEGENVLEGKVVVVLGASSGIGAAISEYFSEKGARVWIAARREERLRKVAGSTMDFSVCDATKYSDVERLAKSVVDKYKKIDLWVNCAGQNMAIGKVWELEEKNVWDEVDVILHSCINGTMAALQHMVRENGGVIVNFCGGGTAKPHLYAAAYSAAKTAIARFTEETYDELIRDGLNVKLFAVNPGLVYNERTAALCESEEGKKYMPNIKTAFETGHYQSPMAVAQFIETTLTGKLDNYAGRLSQASINLEKFIANNEGIAGTEKGYLRVVR